MSEMLAVVAIIAALAALVFPAFVSTRKNAFETSCSSNLRQIGYATEMYMADYDDRYPKFVNAADRINPDIRLGRHKNDDPKDFPTTAQVLRGYITDARVLRCPLDRGGGFGTRAPDLYPFFYSYNDGASYLFAELFDGQSASTWRDPANCIWACDAEVWWHSRHYETYDASTYRIIALFYDWHVAPVRERNSPTFFE